MGSKNTQPGSGANRNGGEGTLAARQNESHNRFQRQGQNAPSTATSRKDLDRAGGKHVPDPSRDSLNTPKAR